MKNLIFITLLSGYIPALCQSTWIEIKMLCDSKKASMVHEAKVKFGPILNELVKEGKFINWDSWEETKGDKLTLTYQFAVDSENKFKATYSQYLHLASGKYPELYKSYSIACTQLKDSVLSRSVMFPLIKNAGAIVMQLPQVDEVPDPSLAYNVVIDLTAYPELTGNKGKIDSSAISWGLQNIGRVLNLHAAAGVPVRQLHFVVAVHGWAADSFMNDESYTRKYKLANPNLPLIRELGGAGVKFLLCGQSLAWMKIDRNQLVPEAKITLTAQTTLTSYQLKGYALLTMAND